MSTFDAAAFLDTTTTEASSTTSLPVPVGDYTAIIDDVKPRQWTSKEDPSKTGVALDIFWAIDSQEVKEALGRDKVTCKQGIMLELLDNGALDVGRGRNVQLGKLREATGLNTPGQPFSFAMLKGRLAKVSVSHRVDKDVIYSEVKAVFPL